MDGADFFYGLKAHRIILAEVSGHCHTHIDPSMNLKFKVSIKPDCSTEILEYYMETLITIATL